MPERSRIWNSRRLPVAAVLDLDAASMVHNDVARVAAGVSVGLWQLRGAIRAGSYTAVLGEDTSGRVAALMVWRAMNVDAAAQQRPRVSVAFIQGVRFRPDLQARVRESLEGNRRPFLTQGAVPRVLIVTDVVNSGETLIPLTAALQAMDVAFDILALDSFGSLREFRRRGLINTDTRIVAAGSQASMDARSSPTMNGLSREKFPDVEPPPGAPPTWRHMPGPAVLRDPVARREVQRSRRAVALAAPALARVIALD